MKQFSLTVPALGRTCTISCAENNDWKAGERLKFGEAVAKFCYPDDDWDTATKKVFVGEETLQQCIFDQITHEENVLTAQELQNQRRLQNEALL